MAKRNPHDLIGRTLGRYALRSLLGIGGMGAVYLAEHTVLGRQAAIKILHPQFAVDEELVRRFFHEARAASMVKHPSIVDVYDFGEEAEIGTYIVMEYLEGVTLAMALAQHGRIGAKRTARIIARVASAVGAAHRADLIHRDLKPDNLFLLPDPDHPTEERVKVLDFGVAKLVADPGKRGVVTGTGQVLGTPRYMSPEQCDGSKTVDSRSDIYALGVIAYEMVCGQPLFTGEGYGELMVAHITYAPRPLSTLVENLPEAFEACILKTLSKSPDLRPPTMEAFATALKASVAHLPTEEDEPLVTAESVARPLPAAELSPTVDASQPSGEAATVQSDISFNRTVAPDRAGTLAPQAFSGSTLTTPPSRSWLGMVIGAGAVAAVAAAILLLGNGTDLEHSGTAAATGGNPAAGSTAPGTAAEPETGSPAPGSAGDPATGSSAPGTADSASTAATAAASIKLSIDSDPAGAWVIDAASREKLGRTPWSEEREVAEGERAFMIRLKGYRAARLSLPLKEGGHRSVKLTRAVAAGDLELPE